MPPSKRRATAISRAKKPAAKKQAAKKPAVKKPATKKPATKKPAAQKPAPIARGVRPKSTRAVTVPKPGTVPAAAGPSPYDIPYTGAPLGAHVSTSGGAATAPPRGVDIGATAIQLFTKQANQWKERLFDDAEVAAFREARSATPVAFTNAHDSYLINLASPNPELRAKSIDSFEHEMRRSNALGLDAVVSHPGNFMDDRASGIARNADAITEVLERVAGPTRLLMELTAGQGTVIGSSFEEMALLLSRLPAALQPRVGVCLDTAHVFAAGYDLVGDFDGVIARFADVLGLPRLGLLHLNDSKAPLGSRKDRHELIGAGAIGDGPFRRIMTDPRLASIAKVLETPKGDDMVSNDRAMLRKLRGFAAGT
ncbi:MAG TPA: deoxyribonuclease IV [Gemmatimonadaceae bacterium]|jgi:deoxyribonuclease-4